MTPLRLGLWLPPRTALARGSALRSDSDGRQSLQRVQSQAEPGTEGDGEAASSAYFARNRMHTGMGTSTGSPTGANSPVF
jgi:hypothetical protein